jgi:FMN phosphatase YigB (HAD superfamily)
VRAFKPAPEAYAMATRKLRLAKEEILFVPFAAWDAAGAAWFGYPTVWVNRARQRAEPGAPDVRVAPIWALSLTPRACERAVALEGRFGLRIADAVLMKCYVG